MPEQPLQPPAAGSPEEVSEAFARALAAGDIEAALEMWSEDASILTASGERVQGRNAVAAALGALIGNGAGVEIELVRTIVAENAALGLGFLTLSGTGADGAPFSHRSSSAVIYSRAEDGRWRIAIDSPWGLPSPPEPPAKGDADGALADGALADGALADGALADGALADGALADGALADGALAD
ncbi:MAG: YybH family protein, partial [Solirubrobacteraceae bacterium]